MDGTHPRPVSAPFEPPRPLAPADRVGAAYDDLAGGYDHFHIDAKSRAENALVASRLARRLRSGPRVVDLGCGTGLLLDLLDIPPERYLGVDVSGGMLEHARKKHPRHAFVQADAQQLGPEHGRFDLVVSLFGSPSYCALEPFAATVERLRTDAGGHFLMYCGPRYVERSTYINKGANLLKAFPTERLAAAYPGSRVWGMSWLVDAAPRWTPEPIARGLLQLDTLSAGRFAPDRCFFLVAER